MTWTSRRPSEPRRSPWLALLCAGIAATSAVGGCTESSEADAGTSEGDRDAEPFVPDDAQDAGTVGGDGSEGLNDSGTSLDADSGPESAQRMPEGKLVYHRYSSYEAGDSEMFVVELPGGTRSEELGLAYGLCNLMNGILSPDGLDLVAMGQAREGSSCGPTDRSKLDVYLLDLSRAGQVTQVTRNEVPDEDPQFSPAGDAVYFKHDGHLARWAVGSSAFTSCDALEAGSFCFAATGGEQSKPVLTPDGAQLCYWEGGGAGADVYCAELAYALEGHDLEERRVPVSTNAGIEDYFPVVSGTHIYYARWRDADSKANVIERKPLSSLSQDAERAGFCTDEWRDYSDPCVMGDDWLTFSTTEAGSGGYDLFVSRFSGEEKQSVDAWSPGLNSEKNELGAFFWSR